MKDNANEVILGWKDNVPRGDILGIGELAFLKHNYTCIPNIEEYVYYYNCNSSGLIHFELIRPSCSDSNVITKSVSVGHNCKSCHMYYPDSVSNQSDGMLICWSCKNS